MPLTMTQEQEQDDREAHTRGNKLVPARERNSVTRRLDRAYRELDAERAAHLETCRALDEARALHAETREALERADAVCKAIKADNGIMGWEIDSHQRALIDAWYAKSGWTWSGVEDDTSDAKEAAR